MSIALDTQCLQCHMGRHLENARKLGDEATAMAFARELMQLYIQAPADAASPWLGPATTELYRKYYGIAGDRYAEEKHLSNRFVMERLAAITAMVDKEPDPVYAGLQFAILGNYLDFSALQGQVSFEKLDAMLETFRDITVDKAVYAQLCGDLAAGKQLLILTDNAGEIGFDRVLAEKIFEKYPHLTITFCVRGGYAHNDATREDAQYVGIPFPVIDNGNCVGGTQLDQLSPAAEAALHSADVILAKGMGNTETMYGCGLPVYYAFLVKCQRFVTAFGKPLMTPLLVREQNRNKGEHT